MRRKIQFLATLGLFTTAFAMSMSAQADTPRIIIPLNPAPTITSPAANARVSSPLTVKGKASKNRQVKVHVVATYTGGEQDLGTFTSTANNAGQWQTTPIHLWLPEGAKNARYTISATQIMNDHVSPVRTITVLPPVNIIYRPIGNIGNFIFTLAPTVTSPANDTRVQSPLTIRGTASKNNDVKINVTAHYTTKIGTHNVARQKDLGTFQATANNDGKWNTAPVNLWLPEGASNAHFEIIASQKLSDNVYKSKVVKVSPPLNIRLIPPRLLPLDLAPAITSPSANARVASPLIVRGTAGKNRKVNIHVVATYTGGEQDLGTFTTTANNDGKWSTTPINLWLPEEAKNARYQISAIQIINDRPSPAKTITVLPPLNVILRPLPLYPILSPPQITHPQADDEVHSPLVIQGKGVAGHKVQVSVKVEWKERILIIVRDKDKDLGTFQVTVQPDGTWKSPALHVSFPDNADDIEYTISAIQLFPGNKQSTAVTVRVEGDD